MKASTGGSLRLSPNNNGTATVSNGRSSQKVTSELERTTRVLVEGVGECVGGGELIMQSILHAWCNVNVRPTHPQQHAFAIARLRAWHE